MRWLFPVLLTVAVRGGPVQKPGLVLPADAETHKEDVRQLFVESYDAYRKYAFGHDDLAPMSLGFADSRNGWGASIIDAMSTMKIMGLEAEFEEAVKFAAQIDFSDVKVPGTVSVFETTIRYLGGLLSAFELSEEKHPVLVQKAKEVADKMAFAWIGNKPIPFGHMNFTTNSPTVANSNIAEAGTLSLEWNTLSKHSGNTTYGSLAEKALRRIASLDDPLPGLAAQGIDPRTGLFTSGYVSWGGASDSYFEYLIKFARLTNTDDPVFVKTWKTAVDSSIRYLLKKSTVGNWTYLADYDSSKKIRYVSSHLACFHGGNWILGGKLLDNSTIVSYGLELTDACWNTYASTATGIGPDGFAFISPEGNYTGGALPNAVQQAYHAKHGYYIRGAAYVLRPEVLESNFHAWRATGDTKYLDRAASAAASFRKHLKANVAFAAIEDVDSLKSRRYDSMESFWFAEVLKYLYLTFDDPQHISLDEWVFNTEAHPFKAPAGKGTYAVEGFKEYRGHRFVAPQSNNSTTV